MARFARGLIADRRGVASIITALCMMALMGSAAVAVDVGSIFMRSRQLQGVADLAALASVRSLDPEAVATPQATAQATADLNRWPGKIAAEVVNGTYVADASIPAGQRFVAGAAGANAVRVTLRAPVPVYFAGILIGHSSVDVRRTATAARAKYAAFSVGSGLVAVNGGVANAMLSALTGSQVQLSAMHYSALVSAKVELLRYLPALQTRLGLKALTFDQLLDTSVTPSNALVALTDTLNADGQHNAAAATAVLAAAATGRPAIKLKQLFALGPYGAQDHVASAGGTSFALNAYALANALLTASDGSRQLALSLDATLPQLSQLDVWLAIGERPNNSPWLTITDSNQVIVRTAQMRLYARARLAPGAVSAVTGGALVDLPLYVEAASAQAKLADIQCPAQVSAQGMTLSVSPSLGQLAIGSADVSKLNDFTKPLALQPATVVNAALAKVTASAKIDVGGASWQQVRLSHADITSGAVKTVFASDIATATAASLIANTDLQVQLAGLSLGLNGNALSSSVGALLAQAAPSLDVLIGQVEAISGARLGQADVWGSGLRCGASALVA